jgi:hypothetical protein
MLKQNNIFIILIAVFALYSCKDIIYEEDNRYVPVYMSYEDLAESVELKATQDLVNPGKIYFKDGYIFINEELKGIHIINNQDPNNPQKRGFINIPGNIDMAIKENILYADSYMDLVAIDISDLNAPEEVARIKNIFPYTLPPLPDYYLSMVQIDESKGVVIDWEVKRVRQRIEDRYYPIYHGGWFDSMVKLNSGYTTNVGVAGNGSSFGIGGSMARFGLNNKHLYTIDQYQFHIFDVETSNDPQLKSEPTVYGDVETLFVLDNHLFLGTRTGMMVYGLDNPEMPQKKATFDHIYSCDPVVVQDHIAYVTLRGGTECWSTVNRLDILSLNQDYSSATLLHSHDMDEPYGLGIDGDVLFICDGQKGLRVFNASDLSLIPENELIRFEEIKAYDVIPFESHLFMIGDDGFYQYDYSDLNNIRQISHIPVVKK